MNLLDCARNDPRRPVFSHQEPAHTPVDRRADTDFALDPTAIRKRLGDRS